MGNARLDQPRLEFVVDNDVITVTLEAVLVVVHDGLQRESDEYKILPFHDTTNSQ